MSQPKRIYISYARQDGAVQATRLEVALGQRGFKTWRDTRGIPPQQDFTVVIEKAIEAADYVVICITPNTQSPSLFALREIPICPALRKTNRTCALCRHSPYPPPLATIPVSTAFQRLAGMLRLSNCVATWKNPPTISGSITPGERSSDPYRDHVDTLYQRVVNTLHHATMPDIDLFRDATPPTIQRDMLLQVLGTSDTPTPPVPVDNLWAAVEPLAGRIVLLGELGAGKTVTLMSLARDAAARRLADPATPLPILGLIRTWDTHHQPSLATWLAANTAGLEADAVQSALDNRTAIIFLDGLDELGSTDVASPAQTARDLRQHFVAHIPANARVLMTCRIEDYAEIGPQIDPAGTITPTPITDAGLAAYSERYPHLWTVLQANDDLRDIVRTPLLLNLFVFAYRHTPADEREAWHEQRGSPGELRAAILGGYLRQRYAWARRKQPHMPVSLAQLRETLCQLAFTNLSERRGQENLIPATTIGEVVGVENALGFARIVITLGIMVKADKIHMRFSHLLWLYYFAYPLAEQHLGNDDPRIRERIVQVLGRIGYPLAVEPLIVALRDEDWGVRDDATQTLSHIGVAAIDPLLGALHDDDHDVRHRAAQALAHIGPPAVASLLVALQDADRDVRFRTAAVLGHIADRRAITALCDALRDDNREVRYQAASALTHIADPQAVAPLLGLLRDTDSDVRQIAAQALHHLGWEPTTPADHITFAIAAHQWNECSSYGSAAIAPLVAALHDDDWRTRQGAATALTHIADPQAVAPLLALLRDDDSDVRQTAAAILGQIGDSRAVRPLIMALRDNHWRVVRRSAVTALGQIGDPQAVLPLMNALHDPDGNVRYRAAIALAHIGQPAVERLAKALHDDDSEVRENAAAALAEIGEPAVDTLIAALRDPDDEVQRLAATALGYTRDPRTVEAFMAILSDPDSPLHPIAADALAGMGEAALDPLLATLYEGDTDLRATATSILAELGDVALEPLADALGDKSWRIRQSAASALGQIGDSWATDPLVTILQDKKAEVRQTVALALGQIGDPRAIPSLIAALHDSYWRVRECCTAALIQMAPDTLEPLMAALHNEASKVRWHAAAALGQIGDAQALDALAAALQDDDSDVRQSVAGALGKIGDPAAVEPLAAALHDESWDVRQNATTALGHIGDARAMEPLVAALSDEFWQVQQSAAWALEQLRTPDAQTALEAWRAAQQDDAG